MQSGLDASTGDPMTSISEALVLARRIIAAKDAPDARFRGAEVDRFVARELRQISEAADRAKTNLAQALTVMGC